MTIDEQIRAVKRRGDVREVRRLREGTATEVAETPDHPETLDAPEMDAGIPTDETPPEDQG